MRDALPYEQSGPAPDEQTHADASTPPSAAHEIPDESELLERSALLLIVLGGIVLVFIAGIIAITR
jgi:hypothetical protein